MIFGTAASHIAQSRRGVASTFPLIGIREPVDDTQRRFRNLAGEQMSKPSKIQRAISDLEAQKAVIELAIAKLKEQLPQKQESPATV